MRGAVVNHNLKWTWTVTTFVKRRLLTMQDGWQERARQNRLRALLIRADEFYPIGMWPVWLQQIFLKRHKNRQERFKLWLFFWRNGMHRRRATYWVMSHGSYDRTAWASIQDLSRMSETREGQEYLNQFPILEIAREDANHPNGIVWPPSTSRRNVTYPPPERRN